MTAGVVTERGRVAGVDDDRLLAADARGAADGGQRQGRVVGRGVLDRAAGERERVRGRVVEVGAVLAARGRVREGQRRRCRCRSCSSPCRRELSASVGVPVTVTFSLKVTVIGIERPRRIGAVAFVEQTFVTVGAVVSTTMFFWPPIEFAPPTAGSVSVALFVAASLIVPPESASELVGR